MKGGSWVTDDYLREIEVPANLSRAMLEKQFGYAAVSFYLSRIAQREREGKIYHNPLKTVYLWATEDKRTCQGFYTTYRGYSHGNRHKNYGGS